MKFSEKLTKLRKENNLSQEALADKLDVSRQSVSKWESGQTYPEMDKLLTLCKLFNVTLDDLTNDSVNYNDVKNKKGTFDSLLSEITYIINKSFNMFRNMKGKQKLKIFGELIIIFLILLLFKIPFNYLISIGENLAYGHENIMFISNIWTFLINILYLILFIFTFLYIYKTNYLDRYELKEIPKKDIDIKEEKIEQTQKEIKIIKEKSPSPLFNFLGKTLTFLLKLFTAFIGIPFIFSFLFIIIYFFITLYLLFTGITYFGFTIIGIGAIGINLLILILIASFLFNHKPSFKKLFILFISGIILSGAGIGINIIDVMNTDFINESPKTNLKLTTKTYEYTLKDNLVSDFITDNNGYYNIEINTEIDDSLNDKIIIETSYYEDLSYFEIYTNNNYNYEEISFINNYKPSKKIINIILNDLKDKTIYNYDKLFQANITVKTSSTTYEKLRNNWNNYYEKIERYRYDEELNECNENINSLYGEQNRLQEIIDEKDLEISELKEKNIELQNKVEEIENNLKNLINN